MGSSGRTAPLFAALAALAVPAAAQQLPAAPPPAIELAVAQRIADDWAVPPGRIQLAWGRSERWPAAAVPFRLVGRGTDGWFTVVFNPDDRNAAAVQLRAGVRDSVPVAARAVRSGTTLAPEDIKVEERVHWGASTSPRADAAPGWEVRRTIAAGEEITWPAVVPPAVIEAGAPVTLSWERGGVRITVNGTALNSARLGESVRARIEGRTGSVVATANGAGTALLAGGDS
ncbi:MAG: flagellar basal body P-ring formation chaperone FlgA [Gemmatimonadales bacterium]